MVLALDKRYQAQQLLGRKFSHLSLQNVSPCVLLWMYFIDTVVDSLFHVLCNKFIPIYSVLLNEGNNNTEWFESLNQIDISI